MVSNDIDVKPEKPWEDHAEGKQVASRTLIGKPPLNHWLHSDTPPMFDLTRPAEPDFPVPKKNESATINTTTTPIVVDPKKTALVIIDMQNFFLSAALGREADGAGNRAKKQLLEYALPAAAAADIQVIWLNWGLTQEDLDTMPPSTLRSFGFESENTALEPKDAVNELGKPRRIYHGLGSDMGTIELEDGTTVDGGRLLMRDTWNADLPPSLKKAYVSGMSNKRPDIWIHKNRISGFWGGSTPGTVFLKTQGLRTLLFAGVNTDQCVAGGLADAYMKGYDCILLKDACGTTSPEYATQCVEYNTSRSMGFVTDCKAFKNGVDEMLSYKLTRSDPM